MDLEAALVKADIETLFDAEAKLRMAARNYSSAEHGQQSIELRKEASRGLRRAARAYAAAAEVFENAVDAQSTPVPSTDGADE